MRSGPIINRLHPYVIGFDDVIGYYFFQNMATGVTTPQEAIQSTKSAVKKRIKEQNDTLDAAETANWLTWNQYK